MIGIATSRTEAKGKVWTPRVKFSKADHLCRGCGKVIKRGRRYCANCAISPATQRLVDAARMGRVSAQTPEVRARRADSQRRHAAARSSWMPSCQPSWLTVEAYSTKIQPLLASMSASAIARQISVSRWYAGRIREGYRPHPRHWQALAQLVGLSRDMKRNLLPLISD